MGLCCSNPKENLPQSNNSDPVLFHKVYDCAICILSGDVLEQQTSALVAQSDISLSMNSKLTKKIREKGGYSLLQEVNRIVMDRPFLNYGEVVSLAGGELPFDYLFIAILPPKQIKSSNFDGLMISGSQSSKNGNGSYVCNNKQFVFQSICNALEQCEKHKLDSISFPVLHAENVNGSEELTPFIMLLAMKTYLEENHSKIKFLKHINIIIKDSPLIKKFQIAFEKVLIQKNDLKPIQLSVTSQNDLLHKQNITVDTDQELIRFGRSYHEESIGDSSIHGSI